MPALHFARVLTIDILLCTIYFTWLYDLPVLKASVTLVLYRFLFLALCQARQVIPTTFYMPSLLQDYSMLISNPCKLEGTTKHAEYSKSNRANPITLCTFY